MLRVLGPPLAQPAALRLRHRCAAQGIFACQSRWLESLFDSCQSCDRLRLAAPLRDLAGEAHDESKTVLQVLKFHLDQEPVPVEIGIAPDDPGECFAEPRLEVMHPQRTEEQLRGIAPTGLRQICKAWVT